MRWDALFADLEADAAGAWQRERDAEIAERTRAEVARLRLVDRLRAVADRRAEPGRATLGVRIVAVGLLRGEVTRVAAEWFLLVTPSHEWVVAADAVLGVTGLPAVARPPDAPGRVTETLGWAAAWRVLARDRTPVQVVRRDGTTVAGVARRAAHDFVELGLDDIDGAVGPHRSESAVEAVPYAALAAVRCPREPVGA